MEIWSGTGDADGKVFFTKDNGVIVGRPYVHRRIRRHLARWKTYYEPAAVEAAINATASNDGWLAQRNQQTVSSLCRDAVSALLDGAGR